MHFFAVHKQGMTLIEILIVLTVAVILALAITPSFLYWLETQRVNQALDSLEGALREAQREAMRRNQTCRVAINTGVNPIIAGQPPQCLPNGPRQLQHVTLRRNDGTASVQFGFQGRTSSTGTIVIAATNHPTLQRCLVVSLGLGIMRTGNYVETDTTGTTADNCRERN
ncbi:type IV fimbrial biogenesis protein FimT [Thermosynechococcus sp. NK55a]|nr:MULTISPECIES: GspH/FimT family pseudopilin [unclassified Thermosynechococcus]AHB89052.1 type IV fimbrial biogenesis protein FimT [Thermosynechococcus sp. NK55a]